tara:strand:- start:2476 stop:3069 length:594 start_codon:yes stop_codon:yes gene_type:complete
MSAQLEMERLRNTYHYQVTSDDGEGRNEIGDFDFQFPSFPLPAHNTASRAIFTLLGCAVGDQVAGQAVGQVQLFSLGVEGLGMGGNNYNSTNFAPGGATNFLRNSNRFLIPNIYEEYDSAAVTTVRGAGGAVSDTVTTPVQRVTGNFQLTNPVSVVCSNPSGNSVNFKLFLDDGTQVPNNANLNTIVLFRIEIVPDS